MQNEANAKYYGSGAYMESNGEIKKRQVIERYKVTAWIPSGCFERFKTCMTTSVQSWKRSRAWMMVMACRLLRARNTTPQIRSCNYFIPCSAPHQTKRRSTSQSQLPPTTLHTTTTPAPTTQAHHMHIASLPLSTSLTPPDLKLSHVRS